MAFDQSTRNRLQSFVSKVRQILTEEFTRQLQNEYGLDPLSGSVTAIEKLGHLDDARLETARTLRSTLSHYLVSSSSSNPREVLERITREQAFTVLNRLAALRMAEARGFLRESLANGYNSKGFQLYLKLADNGLGETGDAYRNYLFSIFDEFTLDLRVLFDRFSPYGLLFPREAAFLEVLELINDPEIAPLWAEDETIGWVYQYFNSKDERKKMRDESAAPRNSRELAVRNQFFTPRYVVEFLTDNTLGRIWYEMTKGETQLKEHCKYLVRRPNEIFLAPDENAPTLSEGDESTESLSQEEMLKQPVYISYRPLKDPREIRVLDPACGSMHFGLYAFDLLELIYQESWEIETKDIDSFLRSLPLKPLHKTYSDKQAFLRDIPRLIIEYNLYGIDIDPRAVQIAGLSLWQRAQRSWQQQKVKPVERLQIRRSNIVCAEPMPGEKAFLQEFINTHLSTTPEEKLLAQLINRVFEAMKLAGEAGSLLKIEEEIADVVKQAKEKWLKHSIQEMRQDFLFANMAMPVQEKLEFDVTEITDEKFWEEAEELIYKALQAYAEQAEESNYQKRLFAEDAARGFAFIEICRKKYDVVLMNPPFGDSSLPSKLYLETTYGDTKGDVYKSFIECMQDRLVLSGMLGIISSRTGFFLSSGADWRERVMLRLFRPFILADLGYGVLDAMVETAAYVLRNLSKEEYEQLTLSLLPELLRIPLDNNGLFSISKYQEVRMLKRQQAIMELESLLARKFIKEFPGSFRRFSPSSYQIASRNEVITAVKRSDLLCLRLLAFEDKSSELIKAITTIHNGYLIDSKVYNVNTTSFRKIPGAPFAYWVSNRIRYAFSNLPLFKERDGCLACITNPAGDDTRYFRCFWEVPTKFYGKEKRWVNLAKGGAFSRYYADIHLVVDWDNKVNSYRGFFGTVHRPLVRPASVEHFFRSGLTYSRRSQKGFSVRPLPADTIFHDKGPGIFVPHNELCAFLSLLNSRVFTELLKLQMAFGSYEVGVVQHTPVPNLTELDIVKLNNLGRQAWLLKRFLDSSELISHAFLQPALAQSHGTTLNERVNNYISKVKEINNTLEEIQIKVDSLVTTLYNCTDKDLGIIPGTTEHLEPEPGSYDDTLEKEEPGINLHNKLSLTAVYVEYILGSIFGRWDIRFATGEKSCSELVDPFAPLPICSPGMLQNSSGLPAEPTDIPNSYPLVITWTGILVDDPGHSEDIEERLREALQVIWKDCTDAIEQEACQTLGVSSLREYFCKPVKFFSDHLQRYSKSRRQAPIYWPLSTTSGSYTLWIYYHRLNDQTLYSCVNDFVEPKLRQVNDSINKLSSKHNRSRDEEKEYEKSQDLEIELRDFRDELLRLAKLPWQPNLNDGVQITAAPLWKLFRLPKWQKTLKETWEKLEKGEYDWAHLAYTLWPERVMEKCKKDKSLAIAHNLEELYQEPQATATANAKTKKKTVSKKAIEVTETMEFEEISEE